MVTAENFFVDVPANKIPFTASLNPKIKAIYALTQALSSMKKYAEFYPDGWSLPLIQRTP